MMQNNIYISDDLKKSIDDKYSLVVKTERVDHENEDCNLLESNVYWTDLRIKNEKCSPEENTETSENEIYMDNSTNYIQNTTNMLKNESKDEFSSENGDLLINEEYALDTISEIVENEIAMEKKYHGNFPQGSRPDLFLKNKEFPRDMHHDSYENRDKIQTQNGSILIQNSVTDVLHRNRDIDQKLKECSNNSHRSIYRLHSLYQVMRNEVSTDCPALASQMVDSGYEAIYTNKSVPQLLLNSPIIAESENMVPHTELPKLPILNETTAMLGNQAVQYSCWAMEGDDRAREIENNKWSTLPKPEKHQDKTRVVTETEENGKSCTMHSDYENEHIMPTDNKAVFIKMEDDDNIFEEYYENSSCKKRMKYEMSPELPFETVDFVPILDVKDIPLPPGSPPKQPVELQSSNYSFIPLPIVIKTEPSYVEDIPLFQNLDQNDDKEEQDVDSSNEIENNKLIEYSNSSCCAAKDKQFEDRIYSDCDCDLNENDHNFYEKWDVAELLQTENEGTDINTEIFDDPLYLPFNRVAYEKTTSSDLSSANLNYLASALLQPGSPPPLLLPSGAKPLHPSRRFCVPALAGLADRVLLARRDGDEMTWEKEDLLAMSGFLKHRGCKRWRIPVRSSDGKSVWITVPWKELEELKLVSQFPSQQKETSTAESNTMVPSLKHCK